MVEWFVKWCELERSDGRMGELGSEWSDKRRREWRMEMDKGKYGAEGEKTE